MSNYSIKFKENIIKKKLSGVPVSRLCEETGLSHVTIYKWLNEGTLTKKPRPDYPGNFSFEKKYGLLRESYTIEEKNKGEWLRKNGLHSDHLNKWNSEIILHMKSPEDNKIKKENKLLKEQLKKAGREIRKKDKALAEAAALLVLKKKYQYLWEGEEK